MDPGFLEVDNTVQYCNTQESECDFLMDPGFLEVDNSAAVQQCDFFDFFEAAAVGKTG